MSKKKHAHSFTIKLFCWWYCAYCGLVTLKNDATRAAIKEGCDRGEG